MNNLIHYSQCPVCSSDKIAPILKAKDFTVSKKEFSIWHCDHCTLRFTQDIPDSSAISHYYQSDEYVSHSDTGKGFINRLYHLVRKKTLHSKRKLIEKTTRIQKGNLLDIGSGTGAFVNEMQQAGWQTTGLEPDAGARARSADLYKIQLNEPAELFHFTPASFDAITLWHVLEHVHDLHVYVERLKKLLKPAGKLFIAVPNYTSYDAGAYKEYWAAYDVPRHLYHFTPKAMRILIEKHSLKIIACKPMWYDSFYVSLLSSKYKNRNTRFLGAGFTGLISNLKALFDTDKCSSVIYIVSK